MKRTHPAEEVTVPVSLAVIAQQISQTYDEMFGPTPTEMRVLDIHEEATELLQYTSPENLREEASDLLCTTLALIHEKGWDISDLLLENLQKLDERKRTGYYNTHT